MAADEEFRKVAEDVRGLARALRSELRTAKWEAKAAARDARREWREYRRSGTWPPHPDWPGEWTPAGWWAAPGVAGTPTTDAPPAPPPTGAPGTGTDPNGAATRGAGPGTSPGGPGGAPGAGPAAWWAQPGQPGQPGPHRGFPWGPYNGPPGNRLVTTPPPRPARPPGPPRPAPPPKPQRPPAPPIRHKRDGSTLLSLLLVLIGLAWLGSTAGIISLSLETVLAAVLVVLGAVMVVTARTDWSLSHKHWPVWLGLIVLVLVMASANSGGIANSFSNLHFGPTSSAPQSWTDTSTPVSNFAGPIALDLSTLTAGNGPSETLRVRNVFGPVTVTLPANPDFTVRIRARTSFGPVTLPGGANNNRGVFTQRTADIAPAVPRAGAPVLTLVITDAFGPVTVNQGVSPTANQSVVPTPKPPALPAVPMP